MHGKSARDWLDVTARSSTLLTQVTRLRRLQSSFVRHAPAALAAAANVSSLTDGTLTLGAANGAVAHKLKLLSTSLLEEFKKQDQEVKQIRIVVQGGQPALPGTPPKRAQLPESAIDPLERLAERLPDSSLKAAVSRFAARQKR